jgi:hypothetical protein
MLLPQTNHMPLVLVQDAVKVNEVYDWKDLEGVQYHFPNQYKNRYQPGTPFVYYRGTRRLSGQRGALEYFGHGRIGRVWRDPAIPESKPKRDWAWFCSLEEYTPFAMPVPAKSNGVFLERIAQNHWSVGVRPLPQDVYEQILTLAGIWLWPVKRQGQLAMRSGFPEARTALVNITQSESAQPNSRSGRRTAAAIFSLWKTPVLERAVLLAICIIIRMNGSM